ncbi:MAG: preprotein translocase subunit SecA [Elusimicrobiales bacterium]|jgi:preprotein translocase subunit SecA|nr:preprotein translocase subunit SecA [Elusimicrobiales bacterium]
MLKNFIDSIFGTKSERDIKKMMPLIEQINSLDEEYSHLSNEELKKKTDEFKKMLSDGKTINDILPYAYAAVREASKRTIGLRPYDVQLIGGIVLNSGKIAEMKTGEGKTLVATLPAYLNALTGKGVHIVTVNDYLAKRDRNWMAPVHEFLGLTVGYVQHDMENAERKKMYECDITYVTNNEIGFDYLRDNMVMSKEEKVLRGLNYAIVDEVDSILIDEARTPLIISGPSEQSTDKYYIVDRVIPFLKCKFVTEKEEFLAKKEGVDVGKGFDAVIDEKNHSVVLTEEGVEKAERLLKVDNIYNDINAEWAHHITQAIRAHFLFKKDVHYVVKDGEIVIVDEFTGRLMPGRRWSDGLHQAIEAKEHLQIKEENQTLATITFQNFFKLYNKISGMTGTAMTEAGEFWEIYKLDVVEIPPNKKCIRRDFPDRIYRTEKEKFNSIVNEIEERWKKGQPLLVGTRSIEKSETLSQMLRKKGIPHQVLNAKYHEMEAQIIAQAGKRGAVTIATNMAGRGTDIVLGGNPPDEKEQEYVVSVGGLCVIGTERHESRRIDNQLRGRCARQGDPGASVFYVSLEDELMRLFGSDRISAIMERLGMKEGEVIESKIITKQIENAQKRVEAMNFDVRKQVLDYDNVMNKQRMAIYELRDTVLDATDVSDRVLKMIEEMVDSVLLEHINPEMHPSTWKIENLNIQLKRNFGFTVDVLDETNYDSLREDVISRVKQAYAQREKDFTERGIDFKELERILLIQIIDHNWKNHLYELDYLRKGVVLRAYGQKDPLIEYQKESYSLFEKMLDRIRNNTVEYLFRIQLPPRIIRPVVTSDDKKPDLKKEDIKQDTNQKSGNYQNTTQSSSKPAKLKVGRNDPCPCGSGKKYKKCCGKDKADDGENKSASNQTSK